MTLGSLGSIKKRLSGQWERGRFYKSIASGEILLPLEVPVKGPSSSEIVEDFDAVRAWVNDIRSGCEKRGLQLAWHEINHRHLGRNSVPKKIIFSDITELAGFLGKKTELGVFEAAFTGLMEAFPELIDWVVSYPFELIKNADKLEKLISVVMWRLAHSHPEIYLRQLSLPGVDTKFIEKHKKLLGQWMDILLDEDQINRQFTGIGKFAQRYGFLFKPEMVRFRLLDPDLKIGGFSDLTVRADEFAALSLSVKRVFIVENDVTALSIPDVKDSMVIFGRGYNFGHLADASWLNNKELWYWGDTDTHGFAILSQFRTVFPVVRSFLMDRETLLAHKMHWGMEKTPTSVDLPELNLEENILYNDLRYNKISDRLRLEQEFIDFSWALEAIGSISC